MVSYRGTSKKLTEAGLWLGRTVESSGLEKELDKELEDAVRMGANEEWYRAQQVERINFSPDLELFEENTLVFLLFREVFTQMKYTSNGNKLVATGLDYTAVWCHLDHYYKPKKARKLFTDLQVIEQGYLKAKNG